MSVVILNDSRVAEFDDEDVVALDQAEQKAAEDIGHGRVLGERSIE
jgi:hypothetical protein